MRDYLIGAFAGMLLTIVAFVAPAGGDKSDPTVLTPASPADVVCPYGKYNSGVTDHGERYASCETDQYIETLFDNERRKLNKQTGEWETP